MSRLARLIGFLEQDPRNLRLLADAANTAYDEGDLAQAAALISRYRAIADLPPALASLEGLVAMRAGDVAKARSVFDALPDEARGHPAVRFNLAWLNALDGRHAEAAALIDEAVIAVAPRAAALKVQALHHLGDLDRALSEGRGMLERLPEDDALLGALSVAAMDADEYPLARALAARAKTGADALTTQGLIALNDETPAEAGPLFDRALAENGEAPRAWLGKGLSLLAAGQPSQAAPCLERGAAIFGDHLGSWIAAGWARFLGGDAQAARRNFETALAHDQNFAETHGGLAVLDLADGDIAGAERRMEIARRLDRACFGAMLAKVLLLDLEGEPDAADRIRRRAMSLPVGIDGKTLAQALTGLGLASGKAKGR